ncbi:Hypothetical predicted protein [Pelobates cultripes]|uniref:Uncharacterized protein n=1 Tax=Pelobates cultripes TaxID=61616 RepID=A0AAD1WL68_PELCU|nr:Hypothetical predicted protein [Pelobates cultripes]
MAAADSSTLSAPAPRSPFEPSLHHLPCQRASSKRIPHKYSPRSGRVRNPQPAMVTPRWGQVQKARNEIVLQRVTAKRTYTTTSAVPPRPPSLTWGDLPHTDEHLRS